MLKRALHLVGLRNVSAWLLGVPASSMPRTRMCQQLSERGRSLQILSWIFALVSFPRLRAIREGCSEWKQRSRRDSQLSHVPFPPSRFRGLPAAIWTDYTPMYP